MPSYEAPRPLPSQSITVSGQDIVPAAGALALAGLACLAAVIATRGIARRAAGVVLALCGAGTAVAVSGSLGASRVIAAAASKVSSPASVASGGAGSTTGGTSSPSGAVVTGGSPAHVVMLGVPWRVAVFAGAAAVVAAGLLTVWRGARWPVMSGRYELIAGGPAEGARPSRAGLPRPGPPPPARLAPPIRPACGTRSAAVRIPRSRCAGPVPIFHDPQGRPARRDSMTHRYSTTHGAVLLAEHEPEVAELARRYLARAACR